MPDVIQLLNQDHRKVEQLFSEFETSKSWQVCRQICDELEIHTQLEEELVYPSLATIDGKLEQQAEEEHDEAKQLIAKIRQGGQGASTLVDTMTELKKAFEHHVEEEESEAWPKLRDELGRTTLGEIGTKVELRKRQLLGSLAGTSTSTLSGSSGSSGDGTRGRLLDLTKEELYTKAKEAGIEGRSSMTKDQLADALSRRG